MNANLSGPSASADPRRSINVLIIEDSESDAFILERALGKGGFLPKCRRVETADAMSAALDQQQWDVILADHSMPQFSAPEALQVMQRRGLDLPFIIVSGHIEEETAVSSMKAGAHDYIMKERLARLVPAVERELREAAMRGAQRECEAELRRAHDELEMRVERRTAALKAANAQLESAFEERRRLENELLEIAENERRSIGFDLHDDLGQKLTGLSMMIKGLEQRLIHDHHAAAQEAQSARELIGEIIHHTHNLAHQFSALDVRGADLSEMLKELANNVEKMFHVPCVLTLKGVIPALPGNTTMQFYKIAQEAVSNAIKHGKATRVWISAICAADKLLFTVRNDGVPFSLPEGKRTRMGLRIMNYRANTVGATFEVKPNGKNGTLVTCCLPVKMELGSEREELNRPGKSAPPSRSKSREQLALQTTC
jgi:signal transduction histidine kinase